jgi:hypothetical protein
MLKRLAFTIGMATLAAAGFFLARHRIGPRSLAATDLILPIVFILVVAVIAWAKWPRDQDDSASGSLARDRYISLRKRYQPHAPKLVIVTESPPVSGLYFYDATRTTNDPLFAAMMRQLAFRPVTKDEGLRELQQRGWVLVDATYEPVDVLSASHRDEVIGRDYRLLCDDLAALMADRSVPVVLIKANVCRILEPKLAKDGFRVLNRGRVIHFPSLLGTDFQQQFSEVLADL